jgi:hypothetical protein
MLRRIPFITDGSLNAYFNSIDSMLSGYETLSEAPMLLELAIWKSKVPQQVGRNNDPHSRDDSVLMVTVIVLNVLSFL